MTRDDIIKMAREAGFNPVSYMGANLESFERFAALVAAAEREACAELAIKISQQDLPEETPESDELRIPCERIAIGVFIAETIRARGEQ